MQLLKITTTPMKYQLEIEPARLEMRQDLIPEGQIRTNPTRAQLQSQRTEVRLDTYEARKSLGFRKIGDLIADGAQKGLRSLSQQTREYVTDGAKMARIEDGVTIGQIVREKMLQQPEMYTAFLPSTGAEISWQPGYLDINWTKPDISFDYKEMQHALNYIPGSVRMEILEYARVDIEYLGGPMYVPPSAAPDYEPPKAM